MPPRTRPTRVHRALGRRGSLTLEALVRQGRELRLLTSTGEWYFTPPPAVNGLTLQNFGWEYSDDGGSTVYGYNNLGTATPRPSWRHRSRVVAAAALVARRGERREEGAITCVVPGIRSVPDASPGRRTRPGL